MSNILAAGSVTTVSKIIQYLIFSNITENLMRAVGTDAIWEVIKRVPARIFEVDPSISKSDSALYHKHIAMIIARLIIPRMFAKVDGFILSPVDEMMGLQLDTIKIYNDMIIRNQKISCK